MPIIQDFFTELDRSWQPRLGAPPITLRVIGCGALLLQTDYNRGTTDSDIFETIDLTADQKRQLRDLAGRSSKLHKRHNLYIDIVANGIPFLPHAEWNAMPAFNASLVNLNITPLAVIDIVVSKLKRLSPNDLADIAAMIDLHLVPHDQLVARFRSAADSILGGGYEVQLPTYIANLNRVERDLLLVDETEIELPSWI